MRIDAHLPLPLSAMLLKGVTQAGGVERLRGVLVIKAAFDLVGAGLRQMVPVADPARSDLVLSDQGFDLGAGRFNYQADAALEKGRTDLVVQGYMGGAGRNDAEGALLLDGALWLRRANVPAPDVTTEENGLDLVHNLFGWMPRAETARGGSFPEDFLPSEGNQLPAQYAPSFNNVYRRSAGFSTPANRNLAPLPMGAELALHRRLDLSDSPYRVALPQITMQARLRRYCGHGPDRPRHWRMVPLGSPTPDTLILAPDENRAVILWRLGWDWSAADSADNRRMQILEAA